MGRLVKLIGSGVGLVAESLNESKKSKSRSNSNTELPQVEAGPSRSALPTTRNLDIPSDAPPQYIEVPDKQAETLISSGRAVPADEKKNLYNDDDGEDDSDDEYDTDEDEAAWELDEAAPPPSYEEVSQGPQDTETLVRDVMHHDDKHMHRSPSNAPLVGRLHCPVVLPQRRPGEKGRGFVRAYAPVLADCGVDQDTFLRFLDNFDKSSKASPIFEVMVISAQIVGLVPSPIAMGVSLGITIIGKAGQAVQSRSRTNTFLDRMNAELFQPRGLYAMIFKYKSSTKPGEADIGTETVDLNAHVAAISKYARPSDAEANSAGWKDKMKNLRLGSGTTHGEIEMPAVAPLIFPALDQTLDSNTNNSSNFKDKAKRSQDFVADYMDRRAQAAYITQNPDSSLGHAAPAPRFKSSLADPAHPAFQGGLVTLLSGGMIPSRGERRGARREFGIERRDMRLDYNNERRVTRGRAPREYSERDRTTRGGGDRGSRRERGGMVKKFMKQDVLYLLVVNMPTEVEMQEARDVLARQKEIKSQQPTTYRY